VEKLLMITYQQTTKITFN